MVAKLPGLGIFRAAPRPGPPPRWLFVALLALAFGSPFLARAAGTMWGSFAMFQRLERYHLEIALHTRMGDERVALQTLSPHLSRDARRLIVPAAGQAYGTDQIELVELGLGDLGRLVCRLRPKATAAELVLTRSGAGEPRRRELEVPCDGR